MKKKFAFIIFLSIALLITACGGNTPVDPPPVDAPAETEPEAEPVVEAPAEPEVAEEEAPAPEPDTPAEPDFVPQPPDGQRVEFESSDGTALVGYYYPATAPNAPIVVLMHWAGGDQTDWRKNGMIDWLQNRGESGGTQSLSQQSAIYPPMPEGLSFALFTFDFRGFGESSGNFGREEGLLDAKAAYEIAKTLDGIDPTRMAGMGSSIGADGVVDGCADGCLGALSFSPGNYLTIPYTDAVKVLDDAGKPVTCIASEGDGESAPTCEAASGENYKSVIYAGKAHGDQFFQNPPDGFGQVIFDWLTLAFEIE
ncbi:MAG: hypothetical protein GY755_20350 [Chloroflexi bacterium]|nr:hypothetical protein [Chloroflexota bacterium]